MACWRFLSTIQTFSQDKKESIEPLTDFKTHAQPRSWIVVNDAVVAFAAACAIGIVTPTLAYPSSSAACPDQKLQWPNFPVHQKDDKDEPFV